MADWGKLPYDLVESILKRLTFIGDLGRFPCVCKAWSKVHIESRHRLPPQHPGLLLPGNGTFFSLLPNNPTIPSLYEIPEGHRIVGAIDCWLVIVDRRLIIKKRKKKKKVGRRFNLFFLLNPFSSLKVELPSVDTPPRDHIFNFMIKVVLSGDPVSSPDFLGMGIRVADGNLAFCKSGDDKWTVLEGEWCVVDEIIYYQEKFYVLTQLCEIFICDIRSTPLVTKFVSGYPEIDIVISKKYLVESAGEVLMVSRFTNNMYHGVQTVRTVCFKIFKLDLSGPSWSPVNSLGDQALFLGLNNSLSLSASDCDGCKPNHIYFIDDNLVGSLDEPWEGVDNGIFNLQDETIKPLYQSDFQRIRPLPIWLTPKPWQTIDREIGG